MKKAIITAIMAGVMVFAMAGSVFAAEKVTAEDARKTALDAAGLKEEQVIFKTAGKTMDDGMEIFEMDFFVPGEAKYEFDIDASTGRIIDQDKDSLRFYSLGNKYQSKVEHFGTKKAYAPEDTLIL